MRWPSPLTSAAATLLLFSCGGQPAVTLPPLVLTVPEQWQAPVAVADPMSWLVCPDQADLQETYACSRELLLANEYTPFDPTQINATHGARDFVWYVTAQQDNPAASIHHVVFAMDGSWSVERVDRFISTFYAMPGNTPVAAGTPWFHFTGISGEPPAAIRYLFGNHWAGALESRFLHTWSDLAQSPADVPACLDVARTTLSEFGLLFETTDSTTQSLDLLLQRMPAATEDSYRPVATLMAVGLLLGDLVQQEFPEFEWVSGDEVMATQFALRHRQNTTAFLRPIDYVLQTWRDGSTAGTPAADYLSLLRQRLTATQP